MWRLASLLALGLALCTACASKRVKEGQRDMRTTLLCLYEEQLIDNLVRVEKGLPVVHLDYGELYAEVKDTFGANTASLNYTSADALVRVVGGQQTPMFDSVSPRGTRTTNATGSTSATAATSLKITATPVIGENSVYAAYLAYNNPKTARQLRSKNGGLAPLHRNATMPFKAPAPRSYVLKRRYADGWWYIPVVYKDRFRNFSMAISVLARGAGAPGSSAYRTYIVDHKMLSPPGGSGSPPEHAYLVRLDVPIRSDRGHIITSLSTTGGDRIKIAVLPAEKADITGYGGGIIGSDVIFGRPVDARQDTIASGQEVSEVILARMLHE